MAVNQAELKTQLRGTHGQGTTLDPLLTTFIRQGVKWIERNYTFLYMEKFGELTIKSNTSFPRLIDLESDRVKDISMFRITLDSGLFHYLKKIEVNKMTKVQTSIPYGYWVQGVSFMVLDNIPDQDYSAELTLVEYTPWSDSDNYTNWLLNNADDVVYKAAMVEISLYLRDYKSVQFWQDQRDRGIKTMIIADEETRGANTDEYMEYGGESGYYTHKLNDT